MGDREIVDVKECIMNAQKHLEVGEFSQAKEFIERGFEIDPKDEKLVQLYKEMHIAQGVLLTKRARDLRRNEMRNLKDADVHHYVDSENVLLAFGEAMGSFDKVLQVDPHNVKALMLKSAALFRVDRSKNAGQVRELMDGALTILPGNEDLMHAKMKLTEACSACDNTGFCRGCHGRGTLKALIIRTTCPSCRGSGICLHCGIL